MSPASTLRLTVVAAAVAQWRVAAAVEAGCAADATDCDRDDAALLQARSASAAHESVAAAASGNPSSWLGKGHDVSAENYWNMAGISSKILFNENMPQSCFVEAACSIGFESKFKTVSSVSEWAGYYADQFGVNVSGGYGGFKGSVDASMSSRSDYSGEWSKFMSYASREHLRKCFQLKMNSRCGYNKTNLDSVFLKRLRTLPRGPPYTADIMEEWKSRLIQRFGTHMTTQSLHGAAFRVLGSSNNRSTFSESCMSSGLCLSFGAMDYASMSLCAKADGCDSKNESTQMMSATCAAVGGDGQLVAQMCNQDVEEDVVNNWLNGGDLESSSSIYEFKFKALADYVSDIEISGWSEISKTMAKATEYNSCRIGQKPPVEEWDESLGCKCVRPCMNGGTLDEATCTCKCLGNDLHGWEGDNCQDTYGSCQPGEGTGNPAAANRCRNNGKCASWFETEMCGPTEYCCATNFGVACCPFDHHCSCTTNECSCAPNTAFLALAPEP